MKKQWRTTIILIVVLIALLMTWLGSTLLKGDTTSTATTTPTIDVPLIFKAEAANVASVAVANEKGGFTLLPKEVKDDSGATSIGWFVQGMADYPFAASTLNDVAALGLNLYAGKEIATGETNLAPYGLDQPKTTLTITLKDGVKHLISFGNVIASGYFNYAMLDQSGTIFTVASSTIEKAQYKLTDLLDKKLVVGIEAAALTSLTFQRPKDNVNLAANCEYSEVTNNGSSSATFAFTLTAPIKWNGNSEMLTILANEALALAVTEFVELDPRDLAKYGLDQPQYTLTLKTKDKSVTVRIGKQADDKSYYMISDAIPAVFTAATSQFTTIDMKVIEMIDRFVALQSIWLVDKIVANLPGAVFTVDISMTKEQKATDEGVIYLLNGKNANIKSQDDKNLFSKFYQRIIAIMIAGVDAAATPVNTHDGSITYYIKADTENNVAAHVKVIEFTKRDDYTYYVFIDGVYTGYYVDSGTLTSTKTDDEGIVVAYKMMMYAIEHAVNGVFNTEEGYQLD
jgi:hypothetical protein